MSYQTNAALVNAQGKIFQAYNDKELRFREPVVFKSLLRQAPFLIPDYNMLRTREDRTVEAKYLARSSRSLGSARSHNHTGSSGASGTLNLSWTTYTDGFVKTLKQGDNNVYTKEEMLANELKNVIANFAEGLEDATSDYLFNNRTGTNAAAVEGSFNATNDAFEITESTNGNRSIQIAKQIMNVLKYSGQYMAICDTVAFNKFEYQANQGSGNSANLSFQFSDIEFIHSVDMDANSSSLSYTKGFWILVPMNSVAALPWIPKQNREGVDTKVNSYGAITNPVDMLQYAVHEYPERVDGTSEGGYTQDVKTEWQVSIDVALQYQPLTGGATPLIAFALV